MEQEARGNTWILAEIWMISNKRISVPRENKWGHHILLQLGLQIKASLQEDRPQQTDMARLEIETLLTSDPPLVKEAW